MRAKPTSCLFREMPADPRFYFVHSYYVVCDEARDVAACTEYGVEFAAALERNNIFATQFHPEKSHKFGMTLFRNFVEFF